ncbi:MiaB-like tRNA modifying enzyme [Methanococcus aeolicus Nankai-3]|uniref:tRNA-t(6)A37 methylthiotransferase n=1 Tax=Methanococcus aeolicus (strain ATCC BAA-1280 / DSM 17508 / OCM 812 / Nankai-3) TaxID=419665 RepID=A6UW93_META3|nr:tRNA (N(6)-L-threonylcarbamoyladenosine(37)-C(2))-methylthiotransferase [Methanococcus aeolicus]ABR56765.1 MiaB-like tRNA modifying enzyme [Methanococcus aeolicus Nankai-3]
MNLKTLKIFIEGYGCTLNTADTNIINNSIKKFKNFIIVNNLDDADIVVINTCVVRLETEHKMISRINYIKSLNKYIVIAGCMPKALKKKAEKINPDILIMPKEAHLIGDIIYNYFKNNIGNENNADNKIEDSMKCGELPHNQASSSGNYNDIDNKLTQLKPNNLIMPLPISEGCTGKCTYCIVKIARGRLASYNPDKIINKAKEFVDNGVKQMLITSQDTACYGFDKNTTLPTLLNEICQIKGDFNIRIGMMHAKNVPMIIDELIDRYKDDKITKFFHLPIQSGDDDVLRAMKREYTVDEYMDIAMEFKRKIKDLNFNTDVIVGFPTETEDNFNNTIELLKKLKPDAIHGAKYTQRKGTEADRLKQVDTKIRKERMKILDKLRKEFSLENHEKYVGKIMPCLIVGKNEGITHNCKTVKFENCEDVKIGEFRKIKIKEALTFGLYGEIIN